MHAAPARAIIYGGRYCTTAVQLDRREATITGSSHVLGVHVPVSLQFHYFTAKPTFAQLIPLAFRSVVAHCFLHIGLRTNCTKPNAAALLMLDGGVV